ncbi:Argininosuccinate lyase [Variovorax sp. SRS16]|uniref:Bug family tripartite tricarboxylate transporter substrate binding protein n=1 Tax=Variovorax sp. SRS16 TaxID=282217 RepID=UPI00131629F1|nr:tripartite tricarboxylate transporter substrate binding protein [Variovorax sp. SRS16]VTU22285.1 Argininosuccinate lyase [Variovorax sp. SRS16]
MKTMLLLRLPVVLMALALTQQASAADPFPNKPLRLIVAYPAGGGLDFVARTLAQRLGEALKQPVVVENRPGASGALGADTVAKSRPDGYTLLLASPAEVIVGPAAGQKTPYDPVADLAPIALAGETPLVLAVNPLVPAKNLPELIAYAKGHPGTLSYGTPGTGSSMHFAGESLNKLGGMASVHIPYRGAAPAVNDVLGNQVPMIIVGMPPVMPHVASGKLKVLAVTTQKRSSAMPDVPSVSEMPGMKGYRFSNWMGVFAPAKTPQAVVDQIGAQIAKIVQEPATRQRLLGAGVEPSGLHGSEFTAFLADERQRYQSIARERGIRFED